MSSPVPEEQQPLTIAEVMDQSIDSESEKKPLVSHSRQRSRCFNICKSVSRWMLKNLLLLLTIVSVVAGIIIGISVREVDEERGSPGYSLMVSLLSFPGELFLRMLKMLILPLIVFSLIAGLGLLESKVAGSLGWKTILYYFSTTVLAIALGLILVVSIQPGGRLKVSECTNSTHTGAAEIELADTILDLIRNMFPDNLFEATFSQDKTVYSEERVTDFFKCLADNFNMSLLNNTPVCSDIRNYVTELNISCSNYTTTARSATLSKQHGMNILGIIIFTIFFAIFLSRQEGGREVVRAIGVLNETIMKLVSLVMWYSPIGIASIIAGKLAEVEDFTVLIAEVGLYVVTVMVGLVVHGCVTLPLLYLIMTRRNPLKVVRAVFQALLTAFGTSSSSATLPVTIQNLEENFSADSRVTRFMLPVGATINMDGTALYEAVAAVFIAQVQGVYLTVDRYIIISITATLASVGAAGIPQAGLFTLVIVLVAVGLDPENIALILAVDWMLDRFRTVVNVLGDSFGVGIVQFYSRKKLAAKSAADSTSSSPEHNSVEPDPDAVTVFQSPEGSVKLSTPQWSSASDDMMSPQVFLGETIRNDVGSDEDNSKENNITPL